MDLLILVPGEAFPFLLAIYVCFFIQCYTAISIFRLDSQEKRRTYYDKHLILSEMVVNIPPTVGVLGTIYALALAIGASGLEHQSFGLPMDTNIRKTILEKFGTAILTTMAGGFTYVLNYMIIARVHQFILKEPSNS
ncbi:MAG: hypothetical protein HQL69_02610 [Magnetococcales bacterium]|nr:hypothetical protein [Magnetococcales bacterium]